jgi:hypothetical protein
MYKKNNIAKSYTLLYGAATLIGYLLVICAEYHLASVFILMSLIVYLRAGGRSRLIIPMVILLIATIGLQFTYLSVTGIFPSFLKMAKHLIGSFSIFPYISFFRQFWVAMVAYVILVCLGIIRFCKNGRLPDHIVFFLISVLIPLILIGYFTWNPFGRYTFQFMPFFTLSCFVVMRIDYFNEVLKKYKRVNSYRFITTLIIIIVFISPYELWGYYYHKKLNFPDHKGAAIFIKSLSIEHDDIILAEDVLQQYYYGVDVDYWLRSIKDAKGFIKIQKDGMYDQYTSTKLIGEGTVLKALINDKQRGDIYIITSGETYDFREWYLSNGIEEVLLQYENKMNILYTGIDKKTQVIKISNLYE